MENFFNEKFKMNDILQQHQNLIQANIRKAEKQANAQFSQSTLDDFGQVLANSLAYQTSVHRIRLAKLQEISGIPPQYHPQVSNTNSS